MVKTRHLSNKPRATKKRSQKKRSQKKRSQRKRARTGKKRGGYDRFYSHPRYEPEPTPAFQRVMQDVVVPGVLLVVVVIAAGTTYVATSAAYSAVSNLFSSASVSGGNTKNLKGDENNVKKAMYVIRNLPSEYLTEIIEDIDKILKELGPQQVEQLYREVEAEMANMKEADVAKLEKYLSEDQKNKLYKKVEQLKSD